MLSMSPAQLKDVKVADIGWAAAGLTAGCENGLSSVAHGAGEEDEEKLPSELDPTDWEEGLPDEHGVGEAGAINGTRSPQPVRTLNGPYHAAVGRDRLSAKYVGKGNHAQDVGMVKANNPLPRRQVGMETAQPIDILLCPRDASWKAGKSIGVLDTR